MAEAPLVTVFLPTRARPRLVYGAVDSLVNTCADCRRLEIFFKADDDDPATREGAIPHILNTLPGPTYRTYSSPRGDGYGELHNWQNRMAEDAAGDWLLLWNDDARMFSPGWDNWLLEERDMYPDEVLMLVPQVARRPRSTEFFFLRRKVFEVLGRLAPTPYIDSWLYSIMAMLGRVFTCSVQIAHHNEIEDQVKLDRKAGCEKTLHFMEHPAVIREKMKDLEKLLAYVEEYHRARPGGVWRRGKAPVQVEKMPGVA
jgi:hypothetical protein